MSWKALLLMGAALIVIVSWSAMRDRASQPVADRATEKLVIRQIGHQLLLQAGDSSSRILPVEERANREYLLRFSAPFTFLSDTLVETVRRVVEANGLPSNYRVEVIQNTPSPEVIYGFQIYKDSIRNIIPCLGRRQEMGFYNLLIMFTETEVAGIDPFSSGVLTGSIVAILAGILFGALYLGRRTKNKTGTPSVQNASTGKAVTSHGPENIQADPAEEEGKLEAPVSPGISIGNLLFLRESQQLVAGSSITILTAKEAKLLEVFAKAQQEVIDRDQLMKEVWEDEGVIVGRSLDMFVSKLRKKLKADPRISILNIHGKGYKLVIGQLAC
ncbi:MAG: winged helix-turn-helix domain-containing protein [Pseudobacter sp.]|uniref:winged helix-turn-helix domain-containing protein n=1 Tax=Pseudobacter sp. TaxID=2045420 RepID=UPI003F7E86BB